MKPFPVILSSPSGGGKTTVAKQLLARRRDLGYSVSCTTRARREGEQDGRDYYFVTEEQFVLRRARGEFAESADVHGRLYGTLRSEVERVLGEGRHVLMDIDVQGARQFREAFPEAVTIFLLPPTADVLLRRLLGRATESRDALERRLTGALNELREVTTYEYVVVNDDLERAIGLASSIIDGESTRVRRQEGLREIIDALLDGLERGRDTHFTKER